MTYSTPRAHAAPTLPAGRLERTIGKSPEQWTTDDLVHLFEREGMRLLTLMHIGGDGWLKTLDFVPRSHEHLRDVIENGERADGSSIFREMGIRAESSDILLKPRLSTAFIDPFSEQPSLVLLCEHRGRDGLPLPESPDTVLRRAHQRVLDESGIDLFALGEVEYFLGRRGTERDAYGASDRGYHASSPFVFGQRLRRQAIAILAEMGVPIKYGHSEVGYVCVSEGEGRIWEQHEIELDLAPLPNAAEGVVLAQWVLRNLAHQQDMLCSFDPIVMQGHAGSGLHFHLSPTREGEHVGRDADGALSEPARWLVGGLVQVGGALMALGNRDEGSLIRLTQGKEAPTSVTWGEFNRSALVRLPVVVRDIDGNAVTPPTVEFRLPDGSAHSYLLLAGIAQAMMLGKQTDDLSALLSMTDATSLDPEAAPQERSLAPLPRSLAEIIVALAESRHVLEAGGIFPAWLVDALVEDYVGRHGDTRL
jgi:glutamine synthetase